MTARKKPNLTYHLNYQTGHPDVCFERDCRIPKRDHFKSFESAQAAYEEHMKAYVFVSFKKGVKPKFPPKELI